jgi:2-oxoglutarate ferredoxin oxidoreductase subunit delta
MAEVKVLSNYCKGCELCIRSCPKGVLGIGSEINTLGYKFAVALHNENCIGCKLCATSCPDSAIEVYK